MVHTQSDTSGRFQLGILSEGRYSVDFDSASLGKAISKIDRESKGPDHTILVVIQPDSPADQPGNRSSQAGRPSVVAWRARM